jgi:hypothetical protein
MVKDEETMDEKEQRARKGGEDQGIDEDSVDKLLDIYEDL